ncbi:MAG: hypothetical protein AAGA55_02080 [Planctomycetota bacterium]
MLEVIVAAGSAFLNPSYSCYAPQPGDSPECVQCLIDTCQSYQDDLDACAGNVECRKLARSFYELAVLNCNCSPVMVPPGQATAIGLALSVAPDSSVDWILDGLLPE